jgi:hypothetical protein
MGADQSPAPPPPDRRLRVLVGVLAALLAVAVIVVGVLWARSATTPVATDAARASATPVPSPTPSGTPAPTASDRPGTATPGSTATPGTPRPSSCDELYSDEMVDAFGTMVLNPQWLDDPDLDLTIGEDDPVLQGVLDDNDYLLCQWAMPDGPSGAGVSTTVAWVDAQDSAVVEAHLRDRGDSCSEQQEGLRCTTQGSNEESYFGESHFLRDGIWVATEYSNAGPEGYTRDIVNNLWPDE